MNGPATLVPGSSRPQPKLRLLLAENETSTWIFLGNLLHPHYRVEIALDGEQAWEAAQRETPDLLLSDVLMPGLDGIGLTRRMRADPRTAGTPVILLTASNDTKTRLRGLEAGADDFLLKPFRVQELLTRIRDHLVPREPGLARGSASQTK